MQDAVLSNKVVHGDLAARNVLVFKESAVKITDFGFSKQLYGSTHYQMKQQVEINSKSSGYTMIYEMTCNCFTF